MRNEELEKRRNEDVMYRQDLRAWHSAIIVQRVASLHTLGTARGEVFRRVPRV